MGLLGLPRISTTMGACSSWQPAFRKRKTVLGPPVIQASKTKIQDIRPVHVAAGELKH